jgi:DNA-binding ferritin-like protein (Dps family)
MEDAVSPEQELAEASEADMQMYCDHTIMEESNEYLETARSNLTQELKT